MKKKQILLSAMLVLLGTGAANAQKALQQGSGQAYTYVQQSGAKIDNLGTAAFDLSASSHPTVEFDANGKAVMKIGDKTVAVLPMNNNGQLVVEFETAVAEENQNKVSKTVGTAGYATLYSPFQLTVPEGDVVVYAPTYNESAHTLKLNSDNKVNGSVIPAGTGVILKNAGNATFAITASEPTYTTASALTGSALTIANPTKAGAVDGKTVYTLGKNSSNDYGFFRYTGDNLNAGSAYLYINTLADAVKGISLLFDEDDADGMERIENGELKIENSGKYLENGKIVIIRGGMKFNANGQRLK